MKIFGSRRRFLLNLSSIVAFKLSFIAQPAVAASKGSAVFAHGGGKFSSKDFNKMLSISGGTRAKVVIVSLGARDPVQTARDDIKWFKAYRVNKVSTLNLNDRRAALDLIASADLIWFSGGYQKKLVLAINAVSGIAEAIRDAYHGGAVVAGSSAGAAVMSKVMISGGRDGNVYLRAGLGLWPEVILDQHVSQRHREWRLHKAIAQNRRLIGVGLDEDTAIILKNGSFQVYGRNKVRIVRWEKGKITEKMLRRGNRFTLARNQ